MRFVRVTLVLCPLVLSGCVVGPDHTPPEVALPSKFAEGRTASNGDVKAVSWWTAFGDSRLNGYVQQGLNDNLDVLQALERINAARAEVTVAGAGSLPSLFVDGSNTTSGESVGGSASSSPTTTITSGSLGASWLLDFFGLYRRSKERAIADLDVAYANVDVARLALLSQAVSAYIDARYFQERLRLAQQSLKSRRETLDLTKLQVEAGAASKLDILQAQGLVASTLAEIPGIETDFRRASHRLATLLGLPASALVSDLRPTGRQPVPRLNVKAGIPADLIRNRPDIRAAERKLASAVASIGVAEAQLYPSITLGGSVTASYFNIAHTADARSLSWSFGPALNLPIFDGGRLNANVEISQSTAKQEYLAWKSAVLSAVEEVENALSAITRDGRTVSALKDTVRSYQEALSLATASYRDGASSLLDVLDAQRQVSTARVNLAQAVQQLAQDYVALNVAVGGGYAAETSGTPPTK